LYAQPELVGSVPSVASIGRMILGSPGTPICR
jgi:hypothetical protein